MMHNRDEQTVPPVLENLTALARRSVQPATSAQLRRGWSAVSSRLAARNALRGRMVVAFASGFVLVGALLLFRVWLHRAAPPETLAYKVEGGSITDGGYLSESGHGGVRLLFAEGTEFALMPGTRGRLHSVNSAGARISIEHGTASFQVTPRTGARWLVDVGPFLVTVKGTVFAVSWNTATERLELRLQHGQVSVTGPVANANGEIALRAGQHLAIDVPKQQVLITEPKPQDTRLPLPAATPPSPTATPPQSAPVRMMKNRPEPPSIGDTAPRSSARALLHAP